MRFWDSSALIPLFVREERSPFLEALVADDPDMVVWWASPVECGSAVHRLRREGVFTPAEAAQVLAGLAATLDAANAVEPGDEMCASALRLLAVHPLRAADAFQLAAALMWTRNHTGGFEPQQSSRASTRYPWAPCERSGVLATTRVLCRSTRVVGRQNERPPRPRRSRYRLDCRPKRLQNSSSHYPAAMTSTP